MLFCYQPFQVCLIVGAGYPGRLDRRTLYAYSALHGTASFSEARASSRSRS